MTPEQKAKKAASFRAWRVRNLEARAAYTRAWRAQRTPEQKADYGKLPHVRFRDHKHGAARRDIPFLFTFEEWWAIWQQSGHWHERGCHRGGYVMARHGDCGPYAGWNVKIIRHEENAAEKTAAQKARLRTLARTLPRQNGKFAAIN